MPHDNDRVRARHRPNGYGACIADRDNWPCDAIQQTDRADEWQAIAKELADALAGAQFLIRYDISDNAAHAIVLDVQAALARYDARYDAAKEPGRCPFCGGKDPHMVIGHETEPDHRWPDR